MACLKLLDHGELNSHADSTLSKINEIAGEANADEAKQMKLIELPDTFSRTD
jgi:hypothetical protein